jgi:hypothetical protein
MHHHHLSKKAISFTNRFFCLSQEMDNGYLMGVAKSSRRTTATDVERDMQKKRDWLISLCSWMIIGARGTDRRLDG